MLWSITYGHHSHCRLDVTEKAAKLSRRLPDQRQLVILVSGDQNRANLFSDPCFGVLKNLEILSKQDGRQWTVDDQHTAYIYLSPDKSAIDHVELLSNAAFDGKLAAIHRASTLKYGGFHEELPEQRLALRFLTGQETVLELGGNIGRNSVVIGRALGDSNRLAVMETDTNTAAQLAENRASNGQSFQIVSAALSKIRLMQSGWDTHEMVGNNLPAGFFRVNTVDWVQLLQQTQLQFDTLVADCEGALFFIFRDMPEMLDNLHLVLMENDYHDLRRKQFVDEVLRSKGFVRAYHEDGGWGVCKPFFFEAWVRS